MSFPDNFSIRPILEAASSPLPTGIHTDMSPADSSPSGLQSSPYLSTLNPPTYLSSAMQNFEMRDGNDVPAHASPEATHSLSHTGIRTVMSPADSSPLELHSSPCLSTLASPILSALASPTNLSSALQNFEMRDGNDDTAYGNTEGDSVLEEETTNLGLDRVPAGEPVQSVQDMPQSAKLCTHPVSDDEDLAELEGMMAPRESSSFTPHMGSQWHPINATKISKSHMSGWQPINSNAEFTSGIKENSIRERTSSNGHHSVAALSSDGEDAEGMIAPGEQDQASSSPWLDDKYFDPYAYINYVNSEDPDVTEVPIVPVDTSQRSQESPKKCPETPKKNAQDNHMADAESVTVQTDTPSMSKHTEIQKTPEKAISAADTDNDQAGEWELVEGSTESPRTNTVSPKKLVIKLRNTFTAEEKTLKFSSMEPAEIDWTSRTHIAMISQWRKETFRSYGVDSKRQTNAYTPTEEAWLILIHRKYLGALEAGHAFKFPSVPLVLEAFNAFFDGKVLKNADGNDEPPRTARSLDSIGSKMGAKAFKVSKDRNTIRELLEGKMAKQIYVPVITEEELRKFLDDGPVVTDDLKDHGKNAAAMQQDQQTSPKRKRVEPYDGEEDNAKRAKLG